MLYKIDQSSPDRISTNTVNAKAFADIFAGPPNGPLNSDISKVGRNAKYAAELYSSFISNFNNESEKLTMISVKVDRFLGFELIIR